MATIFTFTFSSISLESIADVDKTVFIEKVYGILCISVFLVVKVTQLTNAGHWIGLGPVRSLLCIEEVV